MTDGILHRRLADLDEVLEPSNDLVLRSMLAAADSDADLSVTWVRIDGTHRRLRTDASTRIYVVVEGRGSITIGPERIVVERGDLVVVPRGSAYHLAGAMTYLVLNQPGFREGDDLYLADDGHVIDSVPPPPAAP